MDNKVMVKVEPFANILYKRFAILHEYIKSIIWFFVNFTVSLKLAEMLFSCLFSLWSLKSYLRPFKWDIEDMIMQKKNIDVLQILQKYDHYLNRK